MNANEATTPVTDLAPTKKREWPTGAVRMGKCGYQRWLAPATIVVFLLLVSIPSYGKKAYLTITSTPSGASVEIDGRVVGKTPYSVEVPGAYFHGSGSVFGLKHLLGQQVHLRVFIDGYLPKEAELARGPYKWIALNGTYHGDYWLLKAPTFDFTLDKAATAFTGNIQAVSSTTESMPTRATLSPEDIFRRANPAVLLLRGSEGTGSGFLITDTGIAVTNAHVAKQQSGLTATAGNGQTFNARVEYVDSSLDIALVKVEGTNFPHLTLGDISTIEPGSSVLAIGNPSQGFQNTVTKGIVSAIGPMPSESGTWIQTDAAINPGNSGGPLLNSSGDVVGINTQKPFVSGDGRPLQGIGFALSSTDLLSVLRRFYPNVSTVPLKDIAEGKNLGKGKLLISADMDNAEIYLDGDFVGNTPSTLAVNAGIHKIEVKGPKGESWQRNIHVITDSEVSLKALLKENSKAGGPPQKP